MIVTGLMAHGPRYKSPYRGNGCTDDQLSFIISHFIRETTAALERGGITTNIIIEIIESYYSQIIQIIMFFITSGCNIELASYLSFTSIVNSTERGVKFIFETIMQSFNLLISHNRLLSLFNFNINELFIKCLPKILNIKMGRVSPDATLLEVIRGLNIRYDSSLAGVLKLINVQHTSDIIGEDILNYIRAHNIDLTEFFDTNPLNLTYIDLLNIAVNFYIIIIHLFDHRRSSIWDYSNPGAAYHNPGVGGGHWWWTQLSLNSEWRTQIYTDLLLAMDNIFPNINMIINIEQFMNLLTSNWGEIIRTTFLGDEDDDDDY